MTSSGPVASKSQLTRAGETLRHSDDSASMVEALRLIDTWRATFAPAANATAMWIRSVVARSDVEALHIRSRYKRLPSLLQKIIRMRNTRVPQIEDVAGCRVVVPDLEQLRALQRLLRASRVRRVEFPKDVDDEYLALPQAGGYRAVHLHTLRRVNGQGPWKVEIQLRTARQHGWAEQVENFDRVFGHDLKHGRAPGEVLEFFSLASEALFRRDQGRADTPDQRAELTAAYDGLTQWMRRA